MSGSGGNQGRGGRGGPPRETPARLAVATAVVTAVLLPVKLWQAVVIWHPVEVIVVPFLAREAT